MLSAVIVRPTDAGRSHDADLLGRLLEGDSRALRAIYDSFSSLVFGLARRVTGNSASAQDVTQDVFLHLWEHPDAVDLSRGSLRSYLGVVTHRRAIDAVRRTSRATARDERAGREAGVMAPSHETEIVEADFDARASQRVRDAIVGLPSEQRQALELAYYGGCTYREVAARLGIPEGTAKSRLRLALNKLRELIELHERMAPA